MKRQLAAFGAAAATVAGLITFAPAASAADGYCSTAVSVPYGIGRSLIPSTSGGSTSCLMENGSSGDDVVQLQRSLAECNGISVGRWGADGEYGGDTESAVRTFQQGHNLSPDGIYGPATRSAMLWNVYDYIGNWTGCRHL